LKHFILYSLIVIFFSFEKGVHSYKTIKNNENIVVTYDNNEGIIDWDNNDKRILFTSSYTGTKNIYFLDLMKIKFSFATKDFFTANYLNDFTSKEKVYIPITSSIDTSYECPKWSASGNRILSIGKYSGTSEIFYTYISTLKTISTGIKGIVTANWKSNSELYYVKKNEQKNLYQFDLKSKKDSLILDSPQKIIGISKQKGILYLACEGGIIEYKKDTKEKNWYKMNINGKTAFKLDRLNFIVKNINGQAQIINLNNGTSEALFIGDGDGDPALSKSEKFIALYSKFLNGIVIKKLKKKY